MAHEKSIMSLILLVTPTGTRQSWQGIDLTSDLASDPCSIPSQVPTVHWDRVESNGIAGDGAPSADVPDKPDCRSLHQQMACMGGLGTAGATGASIIALTSSLPLNVCVEGIALIWH